MGAATARDTATEPAKAQAARSGVRRRSYRRGVAKWGSRAWPRNCSAVCSAAIARSRSLAEGRKEAEIRMEASEVSGGI